MYFSNLNYYFCFTFQLCCMTVCFIKIDSSRNFKWSTSIDFFNLYEERESMYEYNNTLYVAIVSARYYYWLLTLKQDTGVFDKWNWVYSFKGSFDIEYHELVITYASKQSTTNSKGSINFSCKLIKLKWYTYFLSAWYFFVPFRIKNIYTENCLSFCKNINSNNFF